MVVPTIWLARKRAAEEILLDRERRACVGPEQVLKAKAATGKPLTEAERIDLRKSIDSRASMALAAQSRVNSFLDTVENGVVPHQETYEANPYGKTFELRERDKARELQMVETNLTSTGFVAPREWGQWYETEKDRTVRVSTMREHYFLGREVWAPAESAMRDRDRRLEGPPLRFALPRRGVSVGLGPTPAVPYAPPHAGATRLHFGASALEDRKPGLFPLVPPEPASPRGATARRKLAGSPSPGEGSARRPGSPGKPATPPKTRRRSGFGQRPSRSRTGSNASDELGGGSRRPSFLVQKPMQSRRKSYLKSMANTLNLGDIHSMLNP